KIEDPATCDGTTGCAYSFKVGCHDAGTCRPKPQPFCVEAVENICKVVSIKNDATNDYQNGCEGLKIASAGGSSRGAFDITPVGGGAGVPVAAGGIKVCNWDAAAANDKCTSAYKNVCEAHFREHYKNSGDARGVCEALKASAAKNDSAFVANLFPLCRLVWLHSDAFAVSQDAAGQCSQNVNQLACEAYAACEWVPKP
ncbi:MAG: hypothetical protein AAF471_08020, partial [Myxococcota bacterium]